jgi:hypothetical protein
MRASFCFFDGPLCLSDHAFAPRIEMVQAVLGYTEIPAKQRSKTHYGSMAHFEQSVQAC